jgi:hypothetical protein
MQVNRRDEGCNLATIPVFCAWQVRGGPRQFVDLAQ